jgi:hypothetical protein
MAAAAACVSPLPVPICVSVYVDDIRAFLIRDGPSYFLRLHSATYAETEPPSAHRFSPNHMLQLLTAAATNLSTAACPERVAASDRGEAAHVSARENEQPRHG